MLQLLRVETCLNERGNYIEKIIIKPPPKKNVYRILMVVVYSNDPKLKKLVQFLPSILASATEKVLRDLVSSVNNLCIWVDVVGGAVNTLRTDLKDLKGKAPMGEVS